MKNNPLEKRYGAEIQEGSELKNEQEKGREYMQMPDGTLIDITDLTPEERVSLAKETQENRE